jgi:GT2 family glycosyltransferase
VTLTRASLVVPNYNGRDLLSKNIPTLVAAARAHGDAEVVVVDDGSKDDSVDVLRAMADVRHVVHAQNRGFAEACRTGVEAARHPIVVLLNSDVTVQPGFLAPLVAHFARDPRVFSVSPLILDREGKPSKVTVNLPRVRRGELVWDGVEQDDLLKLSRLPLDVPLDIPSLFGLGGAVAVDRARFVALGGFDPLYRPFYHEDVDLGLMAWRRGWRVLVEPRSQVTHEDGGTINRHHARRAVKVARKRHRILCGWKHAEGEWRRAQTWALWRRALTRWLMLDVRWYRALLGALGRRAQALAAHEKELREAQRPLLEAFDEIRAAWPPAALRT